MSIGGWYHRNVKPIKPLSREEEYKLIEEAKSGNKNARNKLVNAHIKFVFNLVKQHEGYCNGVSITHDDLFQQGCMGLNKAIDKFDPTRKVRLMTVAALWIKAYIRTFAVKNLRMVKVGTTTAERILFYKSGRIKMELESTSDPDELEKIRERLAQDYGISVDDVKSYQMKMLGTKESSLDKSSAVDGDPLYNTIPSYEKGYEEIENRNSLERFLKIAKNSNVTDRELDILTDRYLGEEVVTLKEIGEKHNISRERVRQIEKVALDKIRKNFTRECTND